MHLNIDIKIKI